MIFRRPPLVLWRYLGLEVLTILMVALVAQLLMNVGVAGFQLVRSEGLRLTFVWPILMRMSILSLCYTIPISLLFAVTLGMGRMVADREVTALRSSGISPLQIMMPLLILALVCSFFMVHLNSEVLPPIRFERRNLAKVFLKQLKNLGYGGERTITLSGSMGQIRCNRYRGNVLEGVSMNLWDIGRFTGWNTTRTRSRQKLPVRIRAEQAIVESETDDSGQEQLVIELIDAEISIPDDVLSGESGNSFFFQDIGVGRYRLPISLSDVEPRSRDKATAVLKRELNEFEEMVARKDAEWQKEQNLDLRKQLKEEIRQLKEDVVDIRAEISRRRAFAFSCFTFLWVGIPLTLWLNNRNRLVPFFFGNVLAVGLFYPLVTLGLLLSENGHVSESLMPIVVQFGNILLLALGGVFLWRLSRT